MNMKLLSKYTLKFTSKTIAKLGLHSTIAIQFYYSIGIECTHHLHILSILCFTTYLLAFPHGHVQPKFVGETFSMLEN
jgi:hypothetical protein